MVTGATTAKDLAASTASYEAWVDRRTATSPSARRDKHERMASGPFPFLRATYYRWAVLTAGLTPPPGPVVAAVGDLHVENFGTWRDGEARLVWGVNDLDEADRLPAAFDLLRLATSIEIARLDARLVPSRQDAVGLLLDGYETALAAGGLSTVLERPHPLDVERLLPRSHARRWWDALLALPRLSAPDDAPAAARALLAAALPPGCDAPDLRARTAGMGSRDHVRVVAIAHVRGGPTVREAKATAWPATWWANGRPRGQRVGEVAGLLRASPFRSPDPSLRLRSGWAVRRLAPWADRIEITDLRARADVAALVRAMGAEVANLHLTSADAATLRPLTRAAGRRWLTAATGRMVEATVAEAATWAASFPRRPR